MQRRILVTGGAGFIGRALVKSLLADGHAVTVFDNYSRAHGHEKLDCPIDYGDIRNPSDVANAIIGKDTVVHLAAINGTEFFYTRPDLVLDVAVRGMLNILEACENNKVRDIVFASSSEVYQSPSIIPTPEQVALTIPDPKNPRFSYAGGKLVSELLLLNAPGLTRACVFRPHNVYGPNMGREHVIPQLVMKMMKLTEATTGPVELPIQGDGSETRAFVYVDDAVNGIKRVIEMGRHREIYNVGRPGEISISELVDLIGRHFCREVKIIPSPVREGSVARRCPDIGKLASLGYWPTVSLDEGLQKTIAWYRENA